MPHALRVDQQGVAFRWDINLLLVFLQVAPIA
jgi:hypothetical protein